MASIRLLTGKPATGKTSIIKQVLSLVSLNSGGFFTEEILSGRVRKGFKIITLQGQEATLAHTDFPGRFHVGKYGVDLIALEDTGVTAILEAIENRELIIIDEIGKMELFSSSFKEAVIKAINSDKTVLGSIMLKSNPFADYIKTHCTAEIIEVTTANRNQVLQDTVDWLYRLR